VLAVPHDITITGVAGEVRYGYHLAAELGSWSVTAHDLHAQVVRITNAWYLSQPDLVFVARKADGTPGARRLLGNLQLHAQTLTAQLKERVH
jgi:hypothetical protein